ncbi:WecB/TagA/CpsF family glycosyltransferase [Fictibacillus enclensis]|uniref:WecB/TagA/CpsF family glycosyltransferase n=1 Tax=Fictibacillus enclensis TaxID=1017270 RepID=UPI0024C068C3|nr:WecB/TagA/CpsF family glycosyltransferase [Fictibacillus enclensis]WHY71996.1 WecB/TagA/CpsF family glycosyltransferase [Fictibacillus enclensis]
MMNLHQKKAVYIDFKQQVEKYNIPTCNILGVNIAAINIEWLLKYLRLNIKSESGNRLAGDYICVSNVHTTVISYEEEDYCKIQNDALMAIPDGGPLSTVGRKRGFKSMGRIPGPSLMEELFKISLENGYRHYFYGSTEDTLNKMYTNLIKKYPGIQISGSYSPPFRNLSAEEDTDIIKSINRTSPDFIWVGLGAPKQEKWMANHQGKVNGLMIGVGAGFDYIAGNIERAPEWMQKLNLEWFFRLVQEPKRLFKRYFNTNRKFLWHAIIRGK